MFLYRKSIRFKAITSNEISIDFWLFFNNNESRARSPKQPPKPTLGA